MKYLVNLLSFSTLALFLWLISLFVELITVTSQKTEYTTFGKWFWAIVLILLLIKVFTDIQETYEDLILKKKDTKEVE